MAHKRKLMLGTFRGVILYRQDKPFTKEQIKNWETHYNEKLTSLKIFNEFFRKDEYVLVEKDWKKKYYG